LVAQQPDITLAELQLRLAKAKIKVGQSSIFRFLRHAKMTFKKSLHAAEQDRPDVAADRRALQRLGGKRGNANSGSAAPRPVTLAS
jgi:transposase